jgi:thiol-disulfide isomerase/thioredoxin
MLLERLLLLSMILLMSAAAVCLWRCVMRRRLAHIASVDAPNFVRELVRGETPAILYFATPECAQCRFQQSPILEQLSERVRVAVYAVDAVAQQELASFYGVMTVPSTVVLDPRLQPVAVNHGLATSEKLHRQIATTGR